MCFWTQTIFFSSLITFMFNFHLFSYIFVVSVIFQSLILYPSRNRSLTFVFLLSVHFPFNRYILSMNDSSMCIYVCECMLCVSFHQYGYGLKSFVKNREYEWHIHLNVYDWPARLKAYIIITYMYIYNFCWILYHSECRSLLFPYA